MKEEKVADSDRIVTCACGSEFTIDAHAYAVCEELIKADLLPCPKCKVLIAPKPSPPKRRGKTPPRAGLPEGFEPAKATFKKEGL
jgi:hypothetical protein